MPRTKNSTGNDDWLSGMLEQLLVRCRVVIVEPRGGDAPPGQPTTESEMMTLGWSPLSPMARRVLRVVLDRGPSTCAEIGEALGESPVGRVKYLLAELVERNILSSRGGYSLVVPDGWTWDDLRDVVRGWLDRLDAEERVVAARRVGE